MNRSNRSRLFGAWLAAGCVLALSACAKTLVLDDDDGADAGDVDGGGGSSGSAGHGGDDGDDGDDDIGETGSGGSPIMAGASGAGASGAGASGAGASGGEDDGPGGSGSPLGPETRWTGNPDSCPATRPENTAACDIDEGQVCAYFGDDPEFPAQSFYSECACRMHCGASAPELRWNCYRNNGSGLMDCPAIQPEQGSSCFGLKGYQCDYPTWVTCLCPTDPNDSNWHCGGLLAPNREHPTVVDEGKRVRDMSEAERRAWCEWYTMQAPGFPAPPELEPNADGFYPDTGCAGSSDFLGCAVNRPLGLPASACAANLALSSCEATVRDLNDCAISMEQFQPAPLGCARYLSAPGCAGTIINASADGLGFPQQGDAGSPNACLVRVR